MEPSDVVREHSRITVRPLHPQTALAALITQMRTAAGKLGFVDKA